MDFDSGPNRNQKMFMRSYFHLACRSICGVVRLQNSSSKIILGVIALLATWTSPGLAEMGGGWVSSAPATFVPLRLDSTDAVPAPPFVAPWMTFNTSLSASSGSPVALAIGDVDGDGDLDVVAPRANVNGGFVLIRNEGGGRFGAPVTYAGTGDAAGIVLADFNADGRLDVALTDSDAVSTGNTVSIYFGNGTSSTFAARQPISLGSGAVVPVGIVAADFDGDGDADLAVAGYGYVGSGSSVILLRNNGNGTFAAPVSFPSGAGPYDLAVGDVTGDGRPDLVIGHENYRVTVLANDAAGGFAAPVTYTVGGTYAGPLFPSVALGDVDRDGDLDVLYGNTRTWDGNLTGHIVQLRNDGTGALTRAADIPLVWYSAGPADLATADLNGDGAVDIIGAAYDGRTADGVYMIYNDGTGGFGPATRYPAGQITSAVAAADINGDGRLDVLTADSYSNAVTVRYNPVSGPFPLVADEFVAYGQVFQDAGDIDGDGDLDLFTSGPHPSHASGVILRNDGTGHFPNPIEIVNGQDGVTAGVLRDLNGDGRPDLLFNNANTSSQYDFFTAMNNGDGTFGAITRWVVHSAGWGAIDAFDLDGDGDLDVVDMEALGAPGIADGRFFIALNNGNGTFQTPYSYNLLPRRPDDVVAGDFNHDGHLDLAMTNQGAYGFDTKVFIVLGHGNGTFDPPIVYTVCRGPLYLVKGDFDGDGHLDLATLNSGYNNEGAESVTLLFGTGTGTFNRISCLYAPFAPDRLGASGIEVGDVDGDGDLDLMTTGASNDIALYLNDGTGTFAFPYRLGAVTGTHAPVFADFTGDGRPDIAVLSSRPPVGADSGVAVLPGLSTPLPTPTPGATPTPTPSATPAPTSTPTATPTPTLSPAPTTTPGATPTPTSTPGATATPSPTPSTTPTPAGSATPTPTPAAQALNLSTRMRVQTGDNVGIGGFIITGSAPKRVLVRAIGPSLSKFGVPNALADPVLELHGPGSFATITNDNWRQTQEAEIQATGLPPTNNLESAIVATLTPGSYSAVVRGNNNTSGGGLVEIYDLNQAAASKLANLSTRAFVSTGDNIVIAGFVLGGNSNDRIVVRGIGPSLAGVGIANALADPTLELRDSNGTLVMANNDWQENAAQAAELTAAGLAPTHQLESGIAATLPPGPYTALLLGRNNGAGIGLVEVYDRGAP
jgi:hypothetical protein